MNPPMDEMTYLILQFEVLLSRLDRIEAALTDVTDVDPLALALTETFSGCFNSGEVIALAEAQAIEAGAQGLRVPDLPHRLQEAGITTPYALGRFLSTSPDFEAIGTDRNGKIWSAVSRGFKTAKPIRAGFVSR